MTLRSHAHLCPVGHGGRMWPLFLAASARHDSINLGAFQAFSLSAASRFQLLEWGRDPPAPPSVLPLVFVSQRPGPQCGVGMRAPLASCLGETLLRPTADMVPLSGREARMWAEPGSKCPAHARNSSDPSLLWSKTFAAGRRKGPSKLKEGRVRL